MGPDRILYESYLKIDRAWERIEELEKALPKFERGDGYLYTAERGDNGELWIRINYEPVPAIVSVIIGEILYLLRSALDVAVVSMVRAANPDADLTRIYFPFPKSYDDLHKPATWKLLADLSPAAKKIIVDSRPYEGGNELLVALHKLCNADKHRKLNSVNAKSKNYIWTGRVNKRPFAEQCNVGELTAHIFAEADRHVVGFHDGMKVRIDQIDGMQDHMLEGVVDLANKYIVLFVGAYFGDNDALNEAHVFNCMEMIANAVERIILDLDKILG